MRAAVQATCTGSIFPCSTGTCRRPGALTTMGSWQTGLWRPQIPRRYNQKILRVCARQTSCNPPTPIPTPEPFSTLSYPALHPGTLISTHRVNLAASASGIQLGSALGEDMRRRGRRRCKCSGSHAVGLRASTKACSSKPLQFHSCVPPWQL